MNLPRKTIFWVITLVALGGSFYLINEKAEDISRDKEADLRLFSFNPQDVLEFWIRSDKDDLRARVIKEKEGWWVREPLIAKADGELVEKTLGNIVKARKDAVLFVDPGPDKLKELGLDTPKLEIGFRTEGGVTVIMFGDQGPTGNVAYAMFKGDPRVYRIHSDVRKEADKGIYDLRDKTVLDFDPLKLRRFEIEREGKERVVIEHEKGRWDMIEPRRGRAAMAKVLETLFEIRNSQVKSFIDEKPADLTDYGLVSPRIRLTIFEKEKDGEHILSIGGKDRARRGYYAKTKGSARVFLVEETLVNSLFVKVDEWTELDFVTTQ